MASTVTTVTHSDGTVVVVSTAAEDDTRARVAAEAYRAEKECAARPERDPPAQPPDIAQLQSTSAMQEAQDLVDSEDFIGAMKLLDDAMASGHASPDESRVMEEMRDEAKFSLALRVSMEEDEVRKRYADVVSSDPEPRLIAHGTGLVYDAAMLAHVETNPDGTEFAASAELPTRISTAFERLASKGLSKRCVRVPAWIQLAHLAVGEAPSSP